MSSARSRSARDWRRCSFESGGEKSGKVEVKEAPVNGMPFGVRLAIGRIHEVRNVVTDLLR